MEEAVKESQSDYSGYQSSGDEPSALVGIKTEKDDDSLSLPGPSTASNNSGIYNVIDFHCYTQGLYLIYTLNWWSRFQLGYGFLLSR